jgi:hypothetical protein
MRTIFQEKKISKVLILLSKRPAGCHRRVHLKGSEQQKDSCVSSELLHISQDSAASLFFGHA